LVNTANEGGVKCESLITRMDYPLGLMVGNTCEVWECLEAMNPGSAYTKILDDLEYSENFPG
jgi:thymidine phosphorylase